MMDKHQFIEESENDEINALFGKSVEESKLTPPVPENNQQSMVSEQTSRFESSRTKMIAKEKIILQEQNDFAQLAVAEIARVK